MMISTCLCADETTTRLRSEFYPLDGVAAPDGSVYIVDRNLPGIWKQQNNQLSLFVQGDKNFRKPMNAVRCLAITKEGTLYVGDTATREIYQIKEDGSSLPLTNGLIGIPVDLAVASDGTLYVADLERRAVWKWNPTKSEQPQPIYPKANARGITVDSKDRLWILSQNPEQLVRYDTPDQPTVIIGKRTIEFGHNVLVDANDTAWISDGYAKAIWKVAPDTEPVKAIVSDQFQNPVGLFWNGEKIAIVDPHAATVFQAATDGLVEPLFKIEKTTAP